MMLMMMTDTHKSLPAYVQAVQKQALATSPDRSVFVSANAGTGKTHVLTNRVLRLLLSGAPPDSILCVTYTKAAAAEMRHRLSERLQKWAICPQEELLKDIQQMGEASPSQAQLDKARELFAYILDFGDSPQIDTLHAFCQRILRRFPLEAEVPPFFELTEEGKTDQLLHASVHEVIDNAFLQSSTLLSSIHLLIGAGLDDQLVEHIGHILSDRKMIVQLASEPLGAQRFAEQLEAKHHFVPPHKLPTLLSADIAVLNADSSLLRQFCLQLADGGKRLSDRSRKIAQWLALSDNQQKIAQLDMLFQAMFNADGSRPKSYSDKKIAEIWGDISALADQVAHHIEKMREAIQSAESYRLSVAFCDLAIHVFRHFQQAKREKGLLDFDDLIHSTEQLLGKTEMMAWVRFKLDQGIDHILLDEAQDTSPSQWALIEKLSDSFFDGSDTDRDQERSLFVVGDYKQSIYSFQGAKPDIFTQNKLAYSQKATQAHKPFEMLQFGMSFRSSAAVLEFVDALMAAEHPHQSSLLEGLGDEHTLHESFKFDMPGLVEIRRHTSIETSKIESEPFAQTVDSQDEQADLEHARAIAIQVRDLIHGSYNKQFGRIVKPADIMILVKKRNRFYALLRAQLEAFDIPFAGADRIKLNNQIEILDLLALGDVCLLPQDDLQLACLLKSPLVGLDEDSLFTLAHHREQGSLFDALRLHDGTDTALGKAAEQIRYWLALSQRSSVFEFYSEVLNTGGRLAFYRRLGSVIDDTLDMFLQKARDTSQKGYAGLHGFLSDFRKSGSEIKREFDVRTRNEVRVMSIHGAKGLQAPIVFLPDTLRDKSVYESIYNTPTGPIWSSAATKHVSLLRELKSAQEKNAKQEEDRLLYVALTRAEQALFISGWEKKQNRFYTGSWLELIDKVKIRLPQANWVDENCWQFTSAPAQADIEKLSDADVKEIASSAPDWFFEQPPQEPLPLKPLSPSDLIDAGYATSFAAADRERAVFIGQFAHKLFEILPQYPREKRQAAARLVQQQLTAQFTLNVPMVDTDLQHIITDVCAIIDAPKFAGLFSDDALVEASVSGLVGHLPIAGKIDRMIIQEDQVIILDFKTGKPPASQTAHLLNYTAQMAAYGALLAQIYPEKNVRCYLLWTQNQTITEITPQHRSDIIETLLKDSRQQILNS